MAKLRVAVSVALEFRFALMRAGVNVASAIVEVCLEVYGVVVLHCLTKINAGFSLSSVTSSHDVIVPDEQKILV